MARAFVAVTQGIQSDELTPEMVADRVAAIIDEHDYVVARDAGEEINILRRFTTTEH